jgi:hypothetical protein
MDGWMDGWMDRQTDRQTDRETDGRMNILDGEGVNVWANKQRTYSIERWLAKQIRQTDKINDSMQADM